MGQGRQPGLLHRALQEYGLDVAKGPAVLPAVVSCGCQAL